MKSSVLIEPKSIDLDKTQWENFWILFNLIQTHCLLLEAYDEFSVDNQHDDSKYHCLTNYDSDLHSIIRQLVDENISFESEGSFFLYPNETFPEAVLGFREKKLFIRPLSDHDRKAFLEAGYSEIDPAKFNVEIIRQ